MTPLKKEAHDQIKYYQHRLNTLQAFENMQFKMSHLQRRLTLEEAMSAQINGSTVSLSPLTDGLLAATLLVLVCFLVMSITYLGLSTPALAMSQPIKPGDLVPAGDRFIPPLLDNETIPNILERCAPNCQGINLNWQTVSIINLRDHDLRNALLIGADLSRCDLTGADLRGAQYNQETRWPRGFDPIAAGMVRSL